MPKYGFAEEITHVIGIDEAGWGAIAGPLVVGGVICEIDDYLDYINLKDSKKYTTERSREIAYSNLERIMLSKKIDTFSWTEESDAVSKSPAAALNTAQRIVIDTLLAGEDYPNTVGVIVDGKRTIPGVLIPQRAVIAADSKFKVVSAASIVAKVTRDRHMTKYLDPDYPEFEFYKNKGYPTKRHLEFLKTAGPTMEHRFNIALVQKALDKNGMYKGPDLNE